MQTVLNLYGPINRLGFGIHFTNWAGHLSTAIAKLGHQTSVVAVHQNIDLHNDSLKNPAIHATVMRSQDLSLFNPKAPSICLWQLPWVTEFAGSKRIFYTTFEGTLLNPTQLKALSKIDALWVTTNWHQRRIESMKSQGLAPKDLPVYVMREGIDEEIFHYGETGLVGEWSVAQDPDEVRFVSVGKLEARKGMMVMVPALADAALKTPKKKFVLLAHWYTPLLRSKDGSPIPFTQAAIHFMNELGFKPSSEIVESSSIWFTNEKIPNLEIIIIVRRRDKQEDLVPIYRWGHFGLFPSFAEGWNLPLQESMACGLPPITTDYSGHSEYLFPGTFISCGPGVDVIAKDSQFFKRGDVGTWREMRVEQLSMAIQTAANMSKEEREKIGKNASNTASQFTWRRAAQESIETLCEMGILPSKLSEGGGMV